ncbi:cyclic AMP-dependent transcription factor ATF-2 [Sitodiplosis mosellana]|uniref:cyclic AMP-dependent transcription factor ATF-2 n=1 Tax=Sitodiplosis mosellana TaxID=263140 RepID=UPI0024442934|nr:cyclic AMP-dependent transcription factor ATF-2 [Sitodiplosis mosellana]
MFVFFLCHKTMDGMKSEIHLSPEILQECLGDASCFGAIKHERDITLTLNSIEFKNAKYIADQTPTPTTRLIRNCEEFGLFDDLKHVNPFEETFRQAIDCKTKRPSVLLTTQNSLEVIKSNDEDTLHTPHIIPYNTIGDNKDDSTKIDAKSLIDTAKQPSLDKRTIVNVTDESTAPNPIVVSNVSDKKDIKTIVVCEKGPTPPKTIKIADNTKATTDEVTPKTFRKICPKPIVPIVSNPIKEKIRESLLKLRTSLPIDDNEPDAKVPIANFYIPTSNESHTRNNPKVEIRLPVVKRNIATFHDNTAIERNREAAKRYRNKQKIFHDALQQRNKQLEAENAMLKKQLQLFKKAHEHCSVSLYEI